MAGRPETARCLRSSTAAPPNAPIYTSNFNGANGACPFAGVIADANGNLLGTTYEGGANNEGTVFEIVNNNPPTAPSYASTPIVLVSFNGANGAKPTYAGLVTDANGNLFGTTTYGGASGDGTVFEIVNSGTTGPSYASTPIVLVSFNGANGSAPQAGLIVDAFGNLFGTTIYGGSSGTSPGFGTVFEIAKTAHGYASTPITLVNFNYTNGAFPYAGLIADASGNLFGATYEGGAYGAEFGGYGTVFEVTGSGFIPPGVLAGKPGQASCIGKTVSGLAQKYGGLAHAAAALGYSVLDLQYEIAAFCGG